MVERDRVRLYHQLRSAHLERAAELPPATIVYGHQRYDFEGGLASSLDLVQARGWRAAWFMLHHRIRVLEVNEPLMLGSTRATAKALIGLACGRLTGRPRTRVVCYAIENLDPHSFPVPPGLRHRVARRLDLALTSIIWRRVDRVAFGTEASRVLYQEAMPDRTGRRQSRVVAALPRPHPDAEALAKDETQVVFLGAFVQRKGFELLCDAWPDVLLQVPGAQLVLMGKGALLPQAEAFAACTPGVRLHVDPARQQIRDVLRCSTVLVLPSQPRPEWREQVGLPIVEGLMYGCTIVTTEETGLASWLDEHGHRVIATRSTASELAAALALALRDPLRVADVLSSLPDQDGRLVADRWLFGDETAEPWTADCDSTDAAAYG